MKYSKAKPSADGAKRVDIAIPMFGYKNHVGIDRRHGLIRTWSATDAARHDGAQLPGLLDKAKALVELGRLDTSKPFAELVKLSHVNRRAHEADKDPAFSQRIREGLPIPLPAG